MDYYVTKINYLRKICKKGKEPGEQLLKDIEDCYKFMLSINKPVNMTLSGLDNELLSREKDFVQTNNILRKWVGHDVVQYNAYDYYCLVEDYITQNKPSISDE